MVSLIVASVIDMGHRNHLKLTKEKGPYKRYQYRGKH